MRVGSRPMAEPQSPREVLEALFSRVAAAEGPRHNLLPPEWHMCSAALAALQVVGLVSSEEANAWRARLEGERRRLADSEHAREAWELERPGPRPWGDREAKRAALELLARMLERTSHHREASRFSGSSAGSTDLLNRGYGSIESLHAGGLLDDQERREWNKRFGEVAMATMPAGTSTVMPPLTTARQVRVERVSVSDSDEVAMRRLPPEPSFRSFSGRVLRRVIVVQCDQVHEEPQLLLIELHGDGVVIDWVQESRRDPDVPTLHPRLKVRDDAGTEYRPDGGGGGSFGQLRRMRQAFVPGVPAEATTLNVQLDAVQWRIPLHDARYAPES